MLTIRFTIPALTPAALAACVLAQGPNATPSQDTQDTDDFNLTTAMQGVSEDNIFHDDRFFNWGSGIVKADDGKYHLIYSQMPKEHGFYSWLTDGIVSRAVADRPAGPYKHAEVVLRGRGNGHWDAYTAHCPKVYRFEGRYYIYYMSTHTGDIRLTPEQLEEARHAAWNKSAIRGMMRLNQRIGVAVADRIEGPWQRFAKPLIQPEPPIANIVNNVSVTRRPGGGYLMIVRGDQPDQPEGQIVRMQAVLLADHPLGPWRMQPKPVVKDYNSEDPEVWYDRQRRRYYALYHAFGYMGMITSTDGLNWQRAKHYKVSDKSYTTTGGQVVAVHRYERPTIYRENGRPLVMTAGIRTLDGDTFSMFIPLGQ